MTNSEISDYILHYIQKDQTKSAIMLSAPWGKGKSYYIQNELIPYLAENGAYQCIVISLYGVSAIAEISKSIFFEVKTFEIRKKAKQMITTDVSSIAPYVKFISGTVIKGITGHMGIDINSKSFEELCNSIDLSNKLLIFEDVERVQFNIVDLMGYVNSLVERDGVKVLLVANETELILRVQKEVQEGERKETVNEFTEKSLQYLKIKEKTISDTVQFNGDVRSAIKNIIYQFDNPMLNIFLREDRLDYLEGLLANKQISNLRTFLFACQKTYEIFERIQPNNLEAEYLECIFYSIILFSQSIKSGDIPEWEGTEYLSTKLTNEFFPLFRFCYEYIRWHEFDSEKVAATIEAFKKYRMYSAAYANSDSDINVIFNYYILSTKEVLQALSNVEKRLDVWSDIPIETYVKLAHYLVKFHFLLGYNYSLIRQKMIENVKAHGEDLGVGGNLLSFYEFETEEEKQAFSEFLEDIEESAKKALENKYEFSYEPSDIEALLKNVQKRRGNIHRFISYFDVEKLIDMLFKSNARQIDDFRELMFLVYRAATPSQFESKDREFMQEMDRRLSERKAQQQHGVDEIAQMQIDYLQSNLKSFIKQLS